MLFVGLQHNNTTELGASIIPCLTYGPSMPVLELTSYQKQTSAGAQYSDTVSAVY